MKEVLIALTVAGAIYLMFKKKGKSKKDDFSEYYNTIIKSDKYKVKGKFETK